MHTFPEEVVKRPKSCPEHIPSKGSSSLSSSCMATGASRSTMRLERPSSKDGLPKTRVRRRSK